MPDVDRRVLIVEQNADLAEFLRQVLVAEGYDAEWVAPSVASPETIARFQPDVMVVDQSGPLPDHVQRFRHLGTDAALGSLTVLRVPPSTSAVDSVSSMGKRTHQPSQSFQLDDLLAMIRIALGSSQPNSAMPSSPRNTDVAVRAERILTGYARDVVLRWMQQLWKQAPWAGRFDLRLSDTLSVMPSLIATIVSGLGRRGSAGTDGAVRLEPDLAAKIRRQAILRSRQGISLDAVIREHQMLGGELQRVVSGRRSPELLPEEKRMVEEAIDRTFVCLIDETRFAFAELQQSRAA